MEKLSNVLEARCEFPPIETTRWVGPPQKSIAGTEHFLN